MTSDTARQLIAAQDDGDSVVLPNACPGALIQMDDDSSPVRCFSVVTRQPHAIPPESWSLVQTPDPMPDISGQEAVAKHQFLADHVTCGVIGDNAMQMRFDDDGALRAIRLLPSGTGPAQQQWEAQAKKMIQ